MRKRDLAGRRAGQRILQFVLEDGPFRLGDERRRREFGDGAGECLPACGKAEVRQHIVAVLFRRRRQRLKIRAAFARRDFLGNGDFPG